MDMYIQIEFSILTPSYKKSTITKNKLKIRYIRVWTKTFRFCSIKKLNLI